MADSSNPNPGNPPPPPSQPEEQALDPGGPPDAKPRRMNFRVYGTSGLQQSGGYVLQEKHPRLRGRNAALVFEEMSLNSHVVSATLYVMKTWLTATQWRVEPSIDNDPAAHFWAEFVEQNMEDMSHTWDEFIHEGLSMLDYGYSLAEVCYKRRLGRSDDPTCNSKHNDGYIGWRKLAYRSQLTLDHWWMDEDLGLRGFYQRPPIGGFGLGGGEKFLGIYKIPIEKLLLFRTSTENANPEGRSMLRGAVNSFFRGRRMEDIEDVGIERELVGYPVLEVPEDLLDKDAPPETQALAAQYFDMICQMRMNSLAAMMIPSELTEEGKPSGFKFRVISGAGQRSIDIGSTIIRHDTNIARTMLAEFIMITKGGSYAMHSDKTDAFALSLRSVLRRMAAVINRFAIRQLCAINGCPEELTPVVKHGDVSAPPLKDVAAYVAQLAQSGMLMYDAKTERKLREIGDLPELEEGEPDTPHPPVPPGAAATAPGQPPGNGQTQEQEAAASGIEPEPEDLDLPTDTDENLAPSSANE